MSPIFNVSINGFLVSDIKGNVSKKLLECPIMQYDCIKNQEDKVMIIAVLEKYRERNIKYLTWNWHL